MVVGRDAGGPDARCGLRIGATLFCRIWPGAPRARYNRLRSDVSSYHTWARKRLCVRWLERSHAIAPES